MIYILAYNLLYVTIMAPELFVYLPFVAKGWMHLKYVWFEEENK